LSDAFERVSPALPIGEQHFHSSSTGEKAEGLVLAWRNLPLVRNWSCFQKLLIVNLHGRAENRRNSSRPF
jgi:hypothetical protein